MYRIDQAHLLWVLDHLAEGTVVNQVSVHPRAKELAKLALDRMLANVATTPTGAKNPVLVD
jgi:quinolinate synthase